MQLHKLINLSHACFTTLPADAALDQAVAAMDQYGKTAVVVMAAEQVQGIVTRTDMVRYMAQKAPAAATLDQVMTRDLIAADTRTTLSQALEQMARRRIEHLPVVDAGRLLTVVSKNELMCKRIEELQADIDHLHEYIESLHNASQD